MKIRNYMSAGIRCSRCGSFQIRHISIFDGSGEDEKSVFCAECGHRICTIERDRKNYRFNVSCASCGDKHKFDIPVSEALHTPEKRLICRVTGVTAMIIGTDENIEKFMKNDLKDEIKAAPYDERLEAEAIFDTLSRSGCAFNDVNELFGCLEHFKKLSAEGRVGCECGESLLQLQVEEDGFRVMCANCGRERFLNFKSRENIERIKNIPEIYLT